MIVCIEKVNTYVFLTCNLAMICFALKDTFYKLSTDCEVMINIHDKATDAHRETYATAC